MCVGKDRVSFVNLRHHASFGHLGDLLASFAGRHDGASLWDVLAFLGIPCTFIAIVRRFYHNCQHWLKIQGQLFRSVVVESGVRQGCPLSPILFALVMDPFLRVLEARLAHDVGDGIPRQRV